MADFLYPLEQSGQEFVIHGMAATPEVMALAASLNEHLCLLLSTGYNQIGRDDLVWFRAGLPEQRIVAVGRVQTAPYQSTEENDWRVVVALLHDATRRLQREPEQPDVRAVRQAVWRADDDLEVPRLRKIAGL